jgi:superfamily I DNA/RNA helicase
MKKDWMIKESELDDDQIKVLMATLDKSCIVAGCAGSGKSVLALIKTQRIQKEYGTNYKVIVYTKALCHYMNAGKKELELKNDFFYHEEWRWKKVLKQYGRKGSYWVYERDENGNKIPYMPPADYIIVDEIQDFTKEEILEFVTAAKKNFFFFGDTAQSIYEGLKQTIPVDKIRMIVPNNKQVKEWELYRNYRLPIPVAKVVQYVGVDLEPFIESTYKSKETAVPRFIKYDSQDAQIKAIHDIIKNNEMTDVVILLPDNEYVRTVYNKLKDLGGNYEVRYNDKEDFRNNKDSLNFDSTNPKVMTYHSAKGLQFEAIFLPYIEHFEGDDDSDRKALYVAMTRTYRYLYVMYSGTLPEPLSQINHSLYKDTEVDTVEDW